MLKRISFFFVKEENLFRISLISLTVFTLTILIIVNREVNSPYMDEIFHFSQALKYYNGIFDEWDPKITTPPGLYISTLFLLHPLTALTGVQLDKIPSFRLINIFYFIGNFYLLFKILQKHQVGYKEKEAKTKICILSAANLSMFPVLYFFTFLYYTDVGSTFFVLLMYYLHLEHYLFSAAVAGTVSLFFRQTNIVWIFYVASGTTLDILDVLYKVMQGRQSEVKRLSYLCNDNKDIPYVKDDWKFLLWQIFRLNVYYIIVAVGFLKFIFDNGSIALGDKEAHQVCFHVPQFLYFSLFTLVFSSPYLVSVSKVKDFLVFLYKEKVRVAEVCLVLSYILMHLCYIHPYLLADNRHFTFYVWKRLLGRNMNVSFALIPFYIFSFWSIFHELEHKNTHFKALLAFCIFVSTVPQRLLEFRYFILPYIMLRIQFKAKSVWMPYLEFVLYFLINYIVMILFLSKTFFWEGSTDVQRFMW